MKIKEKNRKEILRELVELRDQIKELRNVIKDIITVEKNGKSNIKNLPEETNIYEFFKLKDDANNI